MCGCVRGRGREGGADREYTNHYRGDVVHYCWDGSAESERCMGVRNNRPEALGLYVPKEARKWPAGGVRDGGGDATGRLACAMV